MQEGATVTAMSISEQDWSLVFLKHLDSDYKADLAFLKLFKSRAKMASCSGPLSTLTLNSRQTKKKN